MNFRWSLRSFCCCGGISMTFFRLWSFAMSHFGCLEIILMASWDHGEPEKDPTVSGGKPWVWENKCNLCLSLYTYHLAYLKHIPNTVFKSTKKSLHWLICFLFLKINALSSQCCEMRLFRVIFKHCATPWNQTSQWAHFQFGCSHYRLVLKSRSWERQKNLFRSTSKCVYNVCNVQG